MNMRLVDPVGDRPAPASADYATVGEFLRAVREHRGQTLEELAKSTRIRRPYLQGIEEGDRSSQPSRPFAIGYVRAYAQALGLDGEAASARFKRETPDIAEPFHDPIGVAHDKPHRSPLIIASVALVLSGVVLWNVVQRAMVKEDRETSSLPAAASEAPAPPPPNAVVAIGASTPAPASQGLPEPYLPPGLPLADGAKAPMVQASSDPAAAAAQIPTVFTPKGAVYGAPEGPESLVVLQAIKPGSLIVRGGAGAVYFARQLAAGEAFRARMGEGLTADVADPSAFALYVAGQSKGPLVSAQTALDKLAVRPLVAAAAPVAASPAIDRTLARPTIRRTRRPAPVYSEPESQADPQGQVAYYPSPRG
jgi:transcriptional regulator with XRE-family HTH domain